MRSRSNKPCAVAGCERTHEARGFCTKHYSRWMRNGHPGLQPTHSDPVQRMLAKVERVDDCWLWTGYVSPDGYARFRVGNRMVNAHRFSYEMYVGPIPAGLDIDHACHTNECTDGSECRHRRCVNPEHLAPATRRENTLRGNTLAASQTAQTRCKHGHEFTPENTYLDKRGRRQCRTCMARRRIARRARFKLQPPCIEDGEQSQTS